MATLVSWSRSLGDRRGPRVRVYEVCPGSMLYVSIWQPGQGESRRSLGHRNRARALVEARALVALRQDGLLEPEPIPLSLADLFRRYTTDGRYLPDGSLKTEAYLQHIVTTGRNLATHFGATFPVAQLTPDRVHDYVRQRREGKITGKPVRTNAIQRELTMLKGALNWARGQHVGGAPLLAVHPLEKYKIPGEKDPKRPMVADEAMDRLEAVAPEVHPFLPVLIVLARHSGRRISAILGLQWDDIDFEQGRIRWRAELDKTRKTWIVPASQVVLTALVRFRLARPGIGPAVLFPHPKTTRHPGKPVTRDLASYWLRGAYQRAKIARPDGSLWHVFRRGWATDRKHLPPKDVAAAGGWRDISTLIHCYQQPDEATIKAVVEYRKPRVATRPSRTRVSRLSTPTVTHIPPADRRSAITA